MIISCFCLQALISLFLLLNQLGCGVFDYKSVDYRESNQTESPLPPTDESTLATCEIGLLGYETYIKSFAESACIACHSDGGIAASTFQLLAEDSANNLVVFSMLLDGTAASVFAKASGAVSHGGGAVLSDDNEADLENFYRMLSLCTTE